MGMTKTSAHRRPFTPLPTLGRDAAKVSNGAGFSDATRGVRVACGGGWRRRSARARNRGVGVGRSVRIYGDLKRLIALGSAGRIGVTDLVPGTAVLVSRAFINTRCSPRLSRAFAPSPSRWRACPVCPQTVQRAAAAGVRNCDAHVMQQPSLFLAALWRGVPGRSSR